MQVCSLASHGLSSQQLLSSSLLKEKLIQDISCRLESTNSVHSLRPQAYSIKLCERRISLNVIHVLMPQLCYSNFFERVLQSKVK